MSEFQYLDGGNSEAQDRLATSFLLAQTSVGLARTGVLSGLAVAQTTTASGSVLIAPGAGVVQASVLAGASLLVNDTTKTLDIFTAHPVGGLPRNDIIAFDATTATLMVIEGDPNAAPTDPTVPATACALARLRHAASATTIPTAKIDDLRVFTALFGATEAWTAYTAALGSSGTAPNLGSGGGQTGYFTESGKHVTGRAIIYWGTGATVGTGFYVVTLPREAVPSWGATNNRVGTVTLVRASGAEVRADLVLINAGQASMVYSTGLTTAAVWAGATAPWVPAAGDTYFVHFDYERT